MKIEEQPKLYFKGVDIIDVNFSSQIIDSDTSDIDIDCSPKVFFPEEDEDKFKIIMDVDISSPDYFSLSLRAVGNFELNTDINEEVKSMFVNSNAVAIMFPYVRAFVNTFSSNLGNAIDQISIPTQFFRGDLDVVQDLNKNN